MLPRDGIGKILAIWQQPCPYVDLARGSLNIVLGACKAGAFAAHSFRAFAKRPGAAPTALHIGWVCCVLECISSYDSYELPLTLVSCILTGRFLMGCGPAVSRSGFCGAGVGRWLLISCPCYLMLLLACSGFKLGNRSSPCPKLSPCFLILTHINHP